MEIKLTKIDIEKPSLDQRYEQEVFFFSLIFCLFFLSVSSSSMPRAMLRVVALNLSKENRPQNHLTISRQLQGYATSKSQL